MIAMKQLFFVCTILLLAISCSKEGKQPPIDNQKDLDGTIIQDSSIVYPERFLLSAAMPAMLNPDLNRPVLICAHGFSATTFEWLEMRDYAKSNGFYTSLVLLGGHGTNYNDFKDARWEDWQQPIIEEYNKLIDLGFTNVSIVGSSTGAALVLDALYENKLYTGFLNSVFLIDPIVIPSNKSLSLVKVLGPLLSYTETTFTSDEVGFWYRFRPYQALDQLNDLTKKVRKKLEKGIDEFPSNMQIIVYKAQKDNAADPISAVLIEKGINSDTKNNIRMIDSDLHVFTRLKGRLDVTEKDQLNQTNAFEAIKNVLIQ